MIERGKGLALAGAALMLGAAAPLPGEQPFAALKLSAEVARAGEAGRDPLLLLAAARLRAGAPVTLADGTSDKVAEWIARAEAIGGDDPRIAALAADIRAEARKGRENGPSVSQTRLMGGERRAFTETFRAGQPAVVYIEGDGDTDLSLRVGTACHDLSAGDVKICAWTPRTTGRVTVEIANTGAVANRVILGMN